MCVCRSCLSKHVWRGRDHRSGVWQWLRSGEGRLCWWWCSQSCVSLNCGTTTPSGEMPYVRLSHLELSLIYIQSVKHLLSQDFLHFDLWPGRVMLTPCFNIANGIWMGNWMWTYLTLFQSVRFLILIGWNIIWCHIPLYCFKEEISHASTRQKKENRKEKGGKMVHKYQLYRNIYTLHI